MSTPSSSSRSSLSNYLDRRKSPPDSGCGLASDCGVVIASQLKTQDENESTISQASQESAAGRAPQQCQYQDNTDNNSCQSSQTGVTSVAMSEASTVLAGNQTHPIQAGAASVAMSQASTVMAGNQTQPIPQRPYTIHPHNQQQHQQVQGVPVPEKQIWGHLGVSDWSEQQWEIFNSSFAAPSVQHPHRFYQPNQNNYSAQNSVTSQSNKSTSSGIYSINSRVTDDELIRQGINDIANLIFVYIVEILALIIGLFLAASRPVTYAMRTIVGDGVSYLLSCSDLHPNSSPLSTTTSSAIGSSSATNFCGDLESLWGVMQMKEGASFHRAPMVDLVSCSSSASSTCSDSPSEGQSQGSGSTSPSSASSINSAGCQNGSAPYHPVITPQFMGATNEGQVQRTMPFPAAATTGRPAFFCTMPPGNGAECQCVSSGTSSQFVNTTTNNNGENVNTSVSPEMNSMHPSLSQHFEKSRGDSSNSGGTNSSFHSHPNQIRQGSATGKSSNSVSSCPARLPFSPEPQAPPSTLAQLHPYYQQTQSQPNKQSAKPPQRSSSQWPMQFQQPKASHLQGQKHHAPNQNRPRFSSFNYQYSPASTSRPSLTHPVLQMSPSNRMPIRY